LSMARIRTVKPEFWSHAVMGRLDDASKCLAIALLNFADDEGYFFADPILVRNQCRPFDDDSTSTRRALGTLVKSGWIIIKKDAQHGDIGKVVNFNAHQKIDRLTPSKIKTYFDSSKDRRVFDDDSTLDLGSRKVSRKGEDQIQRTSARSAPQVGRVPRPVFIHPSLLEISEYCKERNNHVNPEVFFDHYEANGWKVGKNPMKDWQAAARNWIKNSEQFTKIKIENNGTGNQLSTAELELLKELGREYDPRTMQERASGHEEGSGIVGS